MKILLTLSTIFIALSFSASSQQSLQNIRRQSYQTLVYRISADTAEKYLTKGITGIAHYANTTPDYILSSDTLRTNILPVGNYLFVSIQDSMIKTSYYFITNLQPYVINNALNPLLVIRDDKGTQFSDAGVWVNGTAAIYNKAANAFQIKAKKDKDLIARVAIPGDTTFISYSQDEVYHYRNYNKKKFLNKLFHKKKNQNGNGYVIFNKPKYFPTDTIMFKAYFMDSKGKPLTDEVNVKLYYFQNRSYIIKDLTTLKPISPGAYTYKFLTGDTLPNDTRYTITFSTKKKIKLPSGFFKIEDYLLKEVSTFNFKSGSTEYYKGDSITFTASAKDANGLALMDGKVKLILTTSTIADIYEKKIFVPDTIWQETKTLAIEGDTKFSIPTSQFPMAKFNIIAKAIFSNSNNEGHEETTNLNYNLGKNKIEVNFENGEIHATLFKNGKSVVANGEIENDVLEHGLSIKFPYTGKIDPMSQSYYFTAYDGKDTIEAEEFQLPTNYSVTYNFNQNKDTVTASLLNPYKIPVYYTIYYKGKIIFSSQSSEETIIWKELMPTNRIYQIQWRYYWNGEEQKKADKIASLSKVAVAEIGGADVVFPGQKDNITITVKDYKDRELKNVNLTAVSYNSTFGSDINVPEPPYIHKFKSKNLPLAKPIEIDEPSAEKKFPLGKNLEFAKAFHLDTMPYYQFLYPQDYFHLVKTRIQQLLPQVAPYAVKDGVPQEIYELYINNELVYYNGITERAIYSFETYPGYKKIQLRLKDKTVIADSIYLQPNYKHDICFDINKTAPNYKVFDTYNYWTDAEKQLLNSQIMRIENNYENNMGYIWQGDKAYYLTGYGEHVVGPFKTNYELTFFKPNSFDTKFFYEPNYRYRISPKIIRLERVPLLDPKNKIYLPNIHNRWNLGDTLVALPVISYEKPKPYIPFLETTYRPWNWDAMKKSKLQLFLPKDSAFSYTILTNEKNIDIQSGASLLPTHVSKGVYTITLVTANYWTYSISGIVVDSNGTTCLDLRKIKYQKQSSLIDSIQNLQKAERTKKQEEARIEAEKEEKKIQTELKKIEMSLANGSAVIKGMITDKKGKSPIVGVSIMLKGYKKGAVSLNDGSYLLTNIPAGKYVLIISFIGYQIEEKEITISESEVLTQDIQLNMTEQSAQEVVVVGYGIQKSQRSLGYSASVVKTEELTLQGKIAGVNVSNNGLAGSVGSIRIRGMNSFATADSAMYIVDGIVTDKDKIPNADGYADISVLSAADGVALYGAKAANGVVVITTKKAMPKALRKDFRDYAFWQPNLITNEKGQASFEAIYPDNVTSWRTYVVGMDKKHHLLKSSKLVKAFKPILAELAGPQFLIEGDTAVLIGKKMNYTSEAVNIKSEFVINEKTVSESAETIKANDAIISKLNVNASSLDSLTLRLSLTTDKNFQDGEQRKIPVFRKGMTESIGQFSIISGSDSSIYLHFNPTAGPIKLYAKNNSLDILLDEIEHLKSYPYYCMEQTASKLMGYAMEQRIKDQLKEKFSGNKEMQQLIKKLQTNQQFDGGWGWWAGNNSNLFITNYVTRSLLQFRGDALLETNIRNALLYLSNQLPALRKEALLETVYTLSEAGHDMDYAAYLRTIKFDSLPQHQKWQIIAVMQKQKMNYDTCLQKIMSEKSKTLLGGLYWGKWGYWWDRNSIATSVLAYKTLDRISGFDAEKNQITQYFLEKRNTGYWTNTVESATIVSTILPDLLKTNQEITKETQLEISGDTSLTVNKFPFQIKCQPKTKGLTLTKKGGGLLYVSATQNIFNPSPAIVDTNFRIKTYFQNNAQSTIQTLKAGENAVIKIEVEVLGDAEYVQIEIPIPAGCTYRQKDDNWYEHREYFKDKVVIFSPKLSKGIHTYTIQLEPRYSGSYTLNPAKAELMYFPTIYGNNEARKVKIED